MRHSVNYTQEGKTYPMVAAIQPDNHTVLSFLGATTTLSADHVDDVREYVAQSLLGENDAFEQFVTGELCSAGELVWDEFDAVYMTKDEADERAHEQARAYRTLRGANYDRFTD